MVLVCRNCHSEKFAGDYLNAADDVKLSSDLLVLRARSTLDGLARDGFCEVVRGGADSALSARRSGARKHLRQCRSTRSLNHCRC